MFPDTRNKVYYQRVSITDSGRAFSASLSYSKEAIKEKKSLELIEANIKTNRSVISTNKFQKISLIITGAAIVGTFIFSWLSYIKPPPLLHDIHRIDTVVIVPNKSAPNTDSPHLYPATNAKTLKNK